MKEPRVMALLLEFLGSEEAAARWLDTPHPELGNRTPRSVLHAGQGQVVRDMLEAAKLGIPT